MLQGKTLVVTGAASGIGAATAEYAAAQGACVVSVDSSAEPMRSRPSTPAPRSTSTASPRSARRTPSSAHAAVPSPKRR